MTPIVPHSLEAERALLGALLIDPQKVTELDLDPDDLYIVRHKWIFQALRGLVAEGVEADLVTLIDVLDREQHLAETGGPAYLTELVGATPWSTNAASYARVVRDYAKRRQMLNVANQIASAAYDMDQAIDQPITDAIENLSKSGASGPGARPMADWVAELRRDVDERRANPRDVWGIPTGFTDIDALIGGLQPGEVLYIGGEPGVGKSKLMLQMAGNMGGGDRRKKFAPVPGAVFSLEMSGLQMTRRAVSARGEVATRLLKSGKLEGDDLNAYQNGAAEVEKWQVWMSDETALTLTGLRAELARLKRLHGIQWFALDYLLLLSGYEKQNETERSAALSVGVKRIARSLGLACLSVNSVTKDGMGGEALPTNKNIRGSGSVVHDADLIAFLVKNKSQANYATLVFTKTRDVERGEMSIDLYQYPEVPKFADAQSMNLNGRY